MTVLLLGSLVFASPEAVVAAASIEIERAMDLELPNQPKPHWIQIHSVDEHRHTVVSQMGAIQINAPRHVHRVRVEVRVGDSDFDNTNFETFGSQDGLDIRRLPTDDNVLALRRELWISLDKAYKGATEQFSLKQAAIEGHPPPEGPDILPVEPVQDRIGETSEIDDLGMVEWTRKISRPYRDPHMFEAFNVALRQVEQLHTIVSSEGTRLTFTERYSILIVEAVHRSKDGEKHMSLRSWVVDNLSDVINQNAVQDEIKVFTDWLVDLGDAPKEGDYLGPVIFEPMPAAELFRQLLPPEISGTPPESEAPDGFGALPKPIASSRVGRRLLPMGWSVTDVTQSETEQVGHYRFDYEGTPVENVDLVEDGVVKDLLMTRVPREGFTKSTGHGRSEGYRRHVALPGVVRVTPKRRLSQRRFHKLALRLAKQTGRDYVLVVRQLTPLPLSEDFEIAFSGDGPLAGLTEATEIYRLYGDGRKEPVHGMQFIGVDRRVLRDISAAGVQSEWRGMMDSDPSSGRHGMGAFTGSPTSWSTPAVLISELELHTQSTHEQKILPPPKIDAKGLH